MQHILEVENLAKRFGAAEVLNDISFSLMQGEVVSIIGSSGSGKTTLLRCLNFLEQPDAGRILVNGETLFDVGKRFNLSRDRLKAMTPDAEEALADGQRLIMLL